jgi:hypothetical protein
MSDSQPRKHCQGFAKRKKVAGVIPILAVLALIFGVCASFSSPQHGPLAPVSTASEDSYYSLDFSENSPASAKNSGPTLYPYSVIPAGAHDGHQLREAVRREPLVAAHYAGFSVGKARIVRLSHDKLAYVSYRLGNRIYWTKKKVTLHEGEWLLSDGEHLARTRCGNRVSDVPMGPTSPQEPPETVWNTPVAPLHLDLATLSFPDRPQWPARAAVPFLLSLPSVPASPGSIPSAGFPPFIPAFCCNGSSTSPGPSKSDYPPPPGYPLAPPIPTPEPQTLFFLLLGLLFAPVLLRRYR